MKRLFTLLTIFITVFTVVMCSNIQETKPTGPDQETPAIKVSNGKLKVDFNVPSMKSARTYGFVFEEATAKLVAEIGFTNDFILDKGKGSRYANGAKAHSSDILTPTDSHIILPNGNYILRGRFDLENNGWARNDGDKGFDVRFALDGDMVLSIQAEHVRSSTYVKLKINRAVNIASSRVYCIFYLPGGKPLESKIYRYDGIISYLDIHYTGTSRRDSTVSQDMLMGTYDVFCIADKNRNIADRNNPQAENNIDYTLNLFGKSAFTVPYTVELQDFSIYRDPNY